MDDEKNIGTLIQRLLNPENIPTQYVSDGEQALLKIHQAITPYSLVICDQQMPGMTGDTFLEKAALLAPDTLRFLMSGYTDLAAVIRAVNNGAIHRFIPKPVENETFIRSVSDAVAQFESGVEARHLFEQAKSQNLKLFALYKELKQETLNFENIINGLDTEIADLTRRVDAFKDPDLKNKTTLDRLEQSMMEKKILTRDGVARLAVQIKDEVFIQFQDIAARNGLTMLEKSK